MRTLGWLVALGLGLTACTQVSGLDADYTSPEDGGAGVSSSSSSSSSSGGADASASSSSGATSSSGSSGEPSDSGVTSSGSSSGGPGENPCTLALQTGSATNCARCVLGETGCGEVCQALDATGYLVCIRDATDKGEADDCVRNYLRRNEPRASRQTACIDRCSQNDRPCN